MSKKQNECTWQRFAAALEGSKDMATNRGFRMRDGQIVTYSQQKLGLSAYFHFVDIAKELFLEWG